MGLPRYDSPELRGALKDELAAVLTDAAALQRRYQTAIDASDHNVGQLLALHQKWLARREQLLRELAEKEPKAVDFLTLALPLSRNVRAPDVPWPRPGRHLAGRGALPGGG